MNGREKRIPLLDRFLAKVDIKTSEECWNWTAYRDPDGYGRIGTGGRSGRCAKESRVAFELFVSQIPSGLLVLHKCDNPACCNPSHLFLGTNSDNSKDKVAKGRQSKGVPVAWGENVKGSKLKSIQIPEIRKDTRSCTVLAKQYGVSPTLISQVRTRRIWKHIE